jgi:hypothetical protein
MQLIGAFILTLAFATNDQTVAIARIDVTRVDVDAVAAKVRELVKLEAAEAVQFMLAKQIVGNWIAEFTKAGGKELYLVVNLGAMPPPLVVVPLEAGANARALAGLLASGRPDGPTETSPAPFFGTWKTTTLQRAIIAGNDSALERIQNLKASQRPELAKAFAAAGDSAIQILLLPTPIARRAFDEVMPTLPKAIGGGPSTAITQGFLWGAIGVDLPPKLSVRIVIQSKDAAAAGALHKVLLNAYKAIGQEISRVKELGQITAEFDKMAKQLTPQVEGDRLVVQLDEKALVGVLRPIVLSIQEEVQREAAAAPLRRIAIAFHNYHNDHNHLPTAASYDKDGRPLLSWRVHLLPHLGEDALYKQFRLDEPWDSAHNKKLILKMPKAFLSPRAKGGRVGSTTYLVPVGEATMFPGNKPVKMSDVTDGTSLTILFVDATDDQAVIWTKPDDLKYDPMQPQKGLREAPPGKFVVVFVDGGVRPIKQAIDKAALHGLFTRNGGEVVVLPD